MRSDAHDRLALVRRRRAGIRAWAWAWPGGRSRTRTGAWAGAGCAFAARDERVAVDPVHGTVARSRIDMAARILAERRQVGGGEACGGIVAGSRESDRADPGGAVVAVDVAAGELRHRRVAHDVAADD